MSHLVCTVGWCLIWIFSRPWADVELAPSSFLALQTQNVPNACHSRRPKILFPVRKHAKRKFALEKKRQMGTKVIYLPSTNQNHFPSTVIRRLSIYHLLACLLSSSPYPLFLDSLSLTLLQI